MFFSNSKPKSTRIDALAQLRQALRLATNDAIDANVHQRDVVRALEDVLQNLRREIACSMPCPEAVSAGLYDVSKLTIKDRPKPAPAPQRAIRYPRSTDAADMAEYLDSVTQPRR